MSVVFDSRDVSAVVPTLGLDVVSSLPAEYVRDLPGVAEAQDKQGLFSFFPSSGDQKAEGEIRTIGDSVTGMGSVFGIRSVKPEASSGSSSIGLPDDSDDDEGEVQSKSSGSLGSLVSLGESLPIKRGLSNNFWGKSKSFGNLSEVRRVKDIEKRENPLNKRRRTMIAYKWSRKSSFYGCGNNSSMLALNEVVVEEEEEGHSSNQNHDEEEDEVDEEERVETRQLLLKGSKSCFSLTDMRK